MSFQVQLKNFATVVALLSAVLNAFLLTVMCKTKSIRKNSVHSFTFAIIATDLVYGVWLVRFNCLVRNGKTDL